MKTFIEIMLDEEKGARHLFYDTETKEIGRELNLNEDYYLRMVWNTEYYDIDLIEALFEQMKDADDMQWRCIFFALDFCKKDKEIDAKKYKEIVWKVLRREKM